MKLYNKGIDFDLNQRVFFNTAKEFSIMAHTIKVIDRNRIIGGYTLSVRDDWVFKIKKVHLTEEEKDMYLQTFGEQIITYNEFYEWYKSLKQKKSKESETG